MMKTTSPLSKTEINHSEEWGKWCHRGRYSVGDKRRAILKSVRNREVMGYYSDFLLDPTLPVTHSLYPSVDHIRSRDDDSNTVVETRIINDMKSHLEENEFWQAIGHLHAVGIEKGTLPRNSKRRDSWRPKKNYTKH
jgi:hypothetical protein